MTIQNITPTWETAFPVLGPDSEGLLLIQVDANGKQQVSISKAVNGVLTWTLQSVGIRFTSVKYAVLNIS